MLKDEIINIQKGDKAALERMVESFTPLLKKYAYKLGTEDGYQDMSLSFIILLKSFPLPQMKNTSDGAIVNYINATMYHIFLDYAKRNTSIQYAEIALDDLPEKGYTPTYDHFEDLINSGGLRSTEKDILRLIYKYGFSSATIAKLKNISRQSVNQMKKRALSKLRHLLK